MCVTNLTLLCDAVRDEMQWVALVMLAKQAPRAGIRSTGATQVETTTHLPSQGTSVSRCGGGMYTESQSYGAMATKISHVPRGGWRGAVLGPDGDKVYGIPTNATSVRPAAPAVFFDATGPRDILGPCVLQLACDLAST